MTSRIPRFPVLYPILLSLAFLLVFLVHEMSASWSVSYGTGSLFLLATVLGMECIVPLRLSWSVSDGQGLPDLFHLAGSLAGGRAGHIAIEAVGVVFGLHLAQPSVSGLPFGLRLAIGLLLAEATRYFQHRLEHSLPLLWRFHRLHHDSMRLSVIKSGRGHVLMFLLQSLLTAGPILLLGLGNDVLAWCMCAQGFVGILGHANVDLPVGPLGFLIPGPDAHRLHHARIAKGEPAVNLGAATLIFDHLYGTYRSPAHGLSVSEVGVDESTPQDLLGQLLLRTPRTTASPVANSVFE